ncbi:tRNA 2-selenouridine(34) synthase MnmH [Alkaliphilus hydrothermalis]|uniref:tRNA 2-selenouridine synthase n=1 Tax=Alkaliphilus hydrothermalis TaxID=1482730 RepID=A0ABS2NLC1_9FIRM|nr:tRNA 2-selenouridine(34) synthase MnmH [Alkaliphilus hydrothermalis]MBM7613726.1 tRNA 2-selenouridine synthase [Alkaliphilus hydrothermalis]
MLGKLDIAEVMKLDTKMIIDVRSPLEYEEGTIEGAINIPLLNNDERAEIGTLYKQQGPQVAKVRGLEIVSPKLPSIYKQLLELSRKDCKLIIFCAKGGLRSATFVSFFKVLGLELYQLDGGFKAYRNYLLNYLRDIHKHHQFIVLHGFTGVGKTEVLKLLEERGVAVVNLEDLASNKGSVFGATIEDSHRLTQKSFESALLKQLVDIKERYIVVESESKRLGRIIIPNEVFDAMTNGKHILLEASVEERVKRLVVDYVENIENPDELLIKSIGHLKKRIGSKKVQQYHQWIAEKKYNLIAEELVLEYYDPLYQHSVEKYQYNLKINYGRIEEAVDKIHSYYQEMEGKTN